METLRKAQIWDTNWLESRWLVLSRGPFPPRQQKHAARRRISNAADLHSSSLKRAGESSAVWPSVSLCVSSALYKWERRQIDSHDLPSDQEGPRSGPYTLLPGEQMMTFCEGTCRTHPEHLVELIKRKTETTQRQRPWLGTWEQQQLWRSITVVLLPALFCLFLCVH